MLVPPPLAGLTWRSPRGLNPLPFSELELAGTGEQQYFSLGLSPLAESIQQNSQGIDFFFWLINSGFALQMQESAVPGWLA